MKLNGRQRELVADKLVDLGHVVFGALVIGQFVEALAWKWNLFGLGVLVTAIMYALSLWLTRTSS